MIQQKELTFEEALIATLSAIRDVKRNDPIDFSVLISPSDIDKYKKNYQQILYSIHLNLSNDLKSLFTLDQNNGSLTKFIRRIFSIQQCQKGDKIQAMKRAFADITPLKKALDHNHTLHWETLKKTRLDAWIIRQELTNNSNENNLPYLQLAEDLCMAHYAQPKPLLHMEALKYIATCSKEKFNEHLVQLLQSLKEINIYQLHYINKHILNHLNSIIHHPTTQEAYTQRLLHNIHSSMVTTTTHLLLSSNWVDSNIPNLFTASHIEEPLKINFLNLTTQEVSHIRNHTISQACEPTIAAKFLSACKSSIQSSVQAFTTKIQRDLHTFAKTPKLSTYLFILSMLTTLATTVALMHMHMISSLLGFKLMTICSVICLISSSCIIMQPYKYHKRSVQKFRPWLKLNTLIALSILTVTYFFQLTMPWIIGLTGVVSCLSIIISEHYHSSLCLNHIKNTTIKPDDCELHNQLKLAKLDSLFAINTQNQALIPLLFEKK